MANVAIGTASSKALKDTELEGADDMAFKARSAVIIGRRVRRRLAGTDATAKDAPLGDLSEKGYRKARRAAAADPVAVQRKMQATRNVRRSIAVAQEAEATREAAATGKLVSNATVASTAGGSGGVLGAVAGAASQVAPILLAVLLVVLLVSAIVGGDQDESQGMDGMPSWVTYDLVLACLNAHEQYGYAKEELTAELGSLFMSADLGIQNASYDDAHFESHAAYLQSWLSALEDNPSYLFDAAAAADRAGVYVMERYERQLERTREREAPELEQGYDLASESREMADASDALSATARDAPDVDAR